MPNADAAMRWMPAESRKALAKAKGRAKKFHVRVRSCESRHFAGAGVGL